MDWANASEVNRRVANKNTTGLWFFIKSSLGLECAENIAEIQTSCKLCSAVVTKRNDCHNSVGITPKEITVALCIG